MNSTTITLALLNTTHATTNETNSYDKNDPPHWQTNEKMAAISTFLTILMLLSVGCLLLYLLNKYCCTSRNKSDVEQGSPPLTQFLPADNLRRESRTITEEEAQQLDHSILELPRPTRS